MTRTLSASLIESGAVSRLEDLELAGEPVANSTFALGNVAEMHIPAEEGALLTFLARLTSARTIIEVGALTGYSTMALAEAVGPGGSVITCGSTGKWAQIARTAWHRAGFTDRIEPIFGPATETIRAFPECPLFDLAFIDADKARYVEYWEALVPRVRPGGLLIADRMMSPQETGNARAIGEFDAYVHADHRVEPVLPTVTDGITVARKKPIQPQEAGR